MAAISLVFLAAQVLISAVVYFLAKKYDSRSPFLAGILVFVLGFAFILVLDTVIGLFAAQLIIVLIYYVKLRTVQGSSVSA